MSVVCDKIGLLFTKETNVYNIFVLVLEIGSPLHLKKFCLKSHIIVIIHGWKTLCKYISTMFTNMKHVAGSQCLRHTYS